MLLDRKVLEWVERPSSTTRVSVSWLPRLWVVVRVLVPLCMRWWRCGVRVGVDLDMVLVLPVRLLVVVVMIVEAVSQDCRGANKP